MYQCADGQWAFLHPLNLRCLLQHYGSYARCPPTVAGPVLELEDVVQSEATRKRHDANLTRTCSKKCVCCYEAILCCDGMSIA